MQARVVLGSRAGLLWPSRLPWVMVGTMSWLARRGRVLAFMRARCSRCVASSCLGLSTGSGLGPTVLFWPESCREVPKAQSTFPTGRSGAAVSQDGVRAGGPALRGLCPETLSISCSNRRFLSTRSDRDKALLPVPRASRSPALQRSPSRAVPRTDSSSEVRDVLSKSASVTTPSGKGEDLPVLGLGMWMILLQGPGSPGRPGVTPWMGLSCKELGPSSGPLSWSGSVHSASGGHGLPLLQHSRPAAGGLRGPGPPSLAGSSSLALPSSCPSGSFWV